MASGNFGGGSGTELDPYLIEDVYDLDAIRQFSGSSSRGKFFKIVNDIDFNIEPFREEDGGWIPISSFQGKLDGGYHTLRNMVVRRTGSTTSERIEGALVSHVSYDALIENLVFENADVWGERYCSIVAARVTSGSPSNVIIRNVSVRDSVASVDRFNAAGILSSPNFYNPLIENCSFEGTLEIRGDSGSSGGTSGGITADARNVRIKNCYSRFSLKVPSTYTTTQVGGISGSGPLSDDSVIIDNCYAVWKFDGTPPSGSHRGGIIGNITNSGNIQGSGNYWDSDVYNAPDNNNFLGQPLSTEQMKTPNSFVGWENIETSSGQKVWFFREGEYPYLWFSVPIFNKKFILNNGLFLTYEGGWKVVSSSLPTKDMFIEQGMDDVNVSAIPNSAWLELTGDVYEYNWRSNSEGTLDEKDQVTYRILLNGEVVVDWRLFSDAPLMFRRVIENSDLNVGDNIVRVEYRDDLGAIKYWESIVTVVDELPSTVITMAPTSIHLEDVNINLTLDDPEGDRVAFRILVNGVQVHPESGFTSYKESPFTADVNIPNHVFNIGQNQVVIEYKDDFSDEIGTWSSAVTVTNNAPELTMDDGVKTDLTSREDFNFLGSVNDSDGNRVRYRVLVGNKELIPYSEYLESGSEVLFTIPYEDLQFGENIVRIELQDDFKTGSKSTYNLAVTRTNRPPNINAFMVGTFLNVSIQDPDDDLVQFRILLNNNQIAPSPDKGFTDLRERATFQKSFSSNEVIVGEENVIKIISRDSFGEESTMEIVFEGTYSGIMFADQQGRFYSTDLGEVLRYVDKGVIVAGQVTFPVPIKVINKNGYPIENMSLTTNRNQLPEGIDLELSTTSTPFIPHSELTFEDRMEHDDEVTFYLRLRTNIEAQQGSGEFVVDVSADPLNE